MTGTRQCGFSQFVREGRVGLMDVLQVPGISGAPRTVFASEQASALLNRNDLLQVESVFARITDEGERHHGRTVIRLDLADVDREDTTAYAKLYWGRRRIVPRLTDCRCRQTCEPLPLREWNGIVRAESFGLRVPERLALYYEGCLSIRAAVVIRSVPAQWSLEVIISRGMWDQLSSQSRDAILSELSSVLLRLKKSCLSWRGAVAKHLMPEFTSDGECRMWLIDMEGVSKAASPRHLMRMWTRLQQSFVATGARADTVKALSICVPA